MIEKYFFDTDCLSAFLWVKEESILAKLYSGRIILPAQVYLEIKKVPHLLTRVEALKESGDLSVVSMEVNSVEYRDYLQMTTLPENGMRIIGKGEADGNTIWTEMIKKRRMLPADTFSDYEYKNSKQSLICAIRNSLNIGRVHRKRLIAGTMGSTMQS